MGSLKCRISNSICAQYLPIENEDNQIGAQHHPKKRPIIFLIPDKESLLEYLIPSILPPYKICIG